MSMPTARILMVLTFVRAKLDTVEMEKHAKVENQIVLLDHEVPDYNVNSSVLQWPLWPVGHAQSLRIPTHWNCPRYHNII